MSTPLRVVFVITGLGTGGAETMLFRLLQRIDRHRFAPHVVTLTNGGEIGPGIQALGIPVEALHMRPARPDLAAFMRLRQRLRALQPHILHTWMYHADLLGGVAGRLAGVQRVVWGIRHTDLSAQANKRSTLVVARLCAWLSRWVPDSITVNSEVSRQVHGRFGYARDKMVVIPNGFDLSRFSPDVLARESVRSELGLARHIPLIGVIGRFHAQKNQLGFVEAMVHLHRHRADVHFLFAGAGVDSENADLMRLVDSAGLHQICHLLGQRNDVPRLMASLDVLALPSVGESFPNVVGEAMACAVPCAVMDVGDSAAIVGQTGRVVEAGNMTGLAGALADLLAMSADGRAALGHLARDRVARMFEIGAVVKQYEALYESLVPDRGQGS